MAFHGYPSLLLLVLCLWKVSCVLSEVRGAWLPVQYEFTDENSVKAMMSELKDVGINTVYCDVWNQGQVYFNSSTMDSFLTDGSGTASDHLLWTLNAAAELGGIDVYAWFEYGLIAAYGGINNEFAKQADVENWVLGQEGQGFVWLDPDNASVLSFLIGIMEDAWRGYQKLGLKGLQLDDHFSSPTSLGKTVESMNSAMQTLREELNASCGSEMILSLAPSPLDQALYSYNVDWNLWGDNFWFDECVPQLYRSTYKDFKSLFDQTLRGVSRSTQKLLRACGLRVDGSGEPTPWEDVENSIEYAEEFGVDPVIWYAHGVVELYPEEFSQLWGNGGK